jgi:hypothetical protein
MPAAAGLSASPQPALRPSEVDLDEAAGMEGRIVLRARAVAVALPASIPADELVVGVVAGGDRSGVTVGPAGGDGCLGHLRRQKREGAHQSEQQESQEGKPGTRDTFPKHVHSRSPSGRTTSEHPEVADRL